MKNHLSRLIHITLVGGLVVSVAAMVAGLLVGALGAADLGAQLMQIGLIALLATPALRVVIAIVGYILERDWVFTTVSAIVLILLVISYVAGHA